MRTFIGAMCFVLVLTVAFLTGFMEITTANTETDKVFRNDAGAILLNISSDVDTGEMRADTYGSYNYLLNDIQPDKKQKEILNLLGTMLKEGQKIIDNPGAPKDEYLSAKYQLANILDMPME